MTEDTKINKEKVQQNEPIVGDIIKTEWVELGEMVVFVEKDGVTYVETYKHQSTEVST